MAISKKEKAVIVLLCEGYEYKEISKELDISPRTVETYVERLMFKLRVRNRMALIATYIRKYEKI